MVLLPWLKFLHLIPKLFLSFPLCVPHMCCKQALCISYINQTQPLPLDTTLTFRAQTAFRIELLLLWQYYCVILILHHFSLQYIHSAGIIHRVGTFVHLVVVLLLITVFFTWAVHLKVLFAILGKYTYIFSVMTNWLYLLTFCSCEYMNFFWIFDFVLPNGCFFFFF